MTRTICSWDVGIKNLAYCIIQDNNGKFKIIKWGIVNLSNDKKIACCEKIKKKKDICVPCTSNAKFSVTINGKIIGYCGRHKNKYIPFEDGWKEKYLEKIKTDNICCFESKKNV